MERSCERNPWPPRWGKPRLAWLLIGAGLVAGYAAGLGLRRSVYEAQVLLATHSPVILSVAEASQVLCFSKTREGATDIVLGSEHPALRDWHGKTNLGVIFAAGVLG